MPDKKEVANVNNAKKASLKVFLIILGAVFGLGLLVGAFGLFQAFQLKSYAKMAEKMYNDTQKWDENFTEEDLEKASAEMDKIKSEAQKNLIILNTTKVPKKAASLETNLKNYFTGAAKMADASKELLVVMDKVQKETENYNLNVDLNSPEAYNQLINSSTSSFSDLEAKIGKFEKDYKIDIENIEKAEKEIPLQADELKKINFFLF